MKGNKRTTERRVLPGHRSQRPAPTPKRQKCVTSCRMLDPEKSHSADAWAKDRLITQFHFDASKEALRATFLANGGALIAVLAYLGSTAKEGSHGPSQGPLALALGGFGLGLCLAVYATIQMWRLQEEVDYGSLPLTIRNRDIRRTLYVSIAALAVGAAGAGLALLDREPTGAASNRSITVTVETR